MNIKIYIDSVKKVIKENLDTLYNVQDGYPTPEDKFEKWMSSKPDLASNGIMFDLSDNRIVHGLIFRYSDDIIFGSISDGGIDAEVFDLPKDSGKYFARFKSEIKKKYDESLLNEDDCKKQFETYLSKNFIKL